MLCLHKQRAPSAKITPTKVCRTYKYLLHLFHDGIIDRYVLTLWISFVYHLLLLVGAIDGQHALEYLTQHGLENAEGVDDSAYVPYKNASIPEIAFVFDILCCCLKIRFLLETVNAENLLVAHAAHRKIRLNISVASLWTRRFHSESNDGIAVFCKFKTLLDYSSELLNVCNYMITWCNHYVCLRVLALNAPADICNTWCCISATRLTKYMVSRHFRQLLPYHIGIFLVGYHPYVLLFYNTLKPVHRELKQRPAHSKDINKLLWSFIGAHRPEPATYSTGHNYQMIPVLHATNKITL